MDQLIEQIVARTGISEAQAREAVQLVLAVLKEKLPAPIAGQLDGVLNGAQGDVAGQIFGQIGGLFGKQ
jgi:uncharacterized protein (DUF2267 family)